MMTSAKLNKLQDKYRLHIENAYSFQFTDPSLSDYHEYKAGKILAKLNFLLRATA